MDEQPMQTQDGAPVLRGDRIARRTLLAGALGTAGLAATMPRAFGSTGTPAAHADEHAGDHAGHLRRAGEGGAVRTVTLYAVALPNNELGYGLTPESASIPGPTIEAVEGDEIQVRLVNTTTETVSLHAHGVDYAAADDGTPANGSVVAPGAERLYTWRTHAPTQRPDGSWEPGSAGYWHYHDHAVGSVHGTRGIARGLYGALVVRRPGDILPDVTNVVVFNEVAINNKRYPDTPNFTAKLGDRVEWVVITHDNGMHTFHLHAHRWANNRTGMLGGPDDSTAFIDNHTVGPGESFGFQVLAGEHVGSGAWMYHCHVQFHSDGGMVAIWTVLNADGSLPPGHEHTMEVVDHQLKEAAAAGGHAGHQ